MNQVTPSPKGSDRASSAERPFFITGGSLPRDAACYVRRRADEELYDGLAHGGFCYVLTARQMGKSSLMVRTATRLKREAGAAVASLDLTAVGQNLTASQWYRGLLGRLGRQLDVEKEVEERWRTSEGLGPLLRWSDTVFDTLLERFTGPVILFVDEIDAVQSLPFSADELFGAIRECYNRRALDPRYGRISFCLLGVAAPSELIADPKMSPFNIGTRIGLSDFTPTEAAPLAQGLAGGSPVLARVLYWTGGHPYLTQRLCMAADEEGTESPQGVDRLCERLFFGRGARLSDDNLLFVQDRLLRSDADPAALLTHYGRIRAGRRFVGAVIPDHGTLTESLRLAGVVHAEAPARLYVRNRIYARVFDRRWVTEHLPGAELRRQRAAFRRGLSLALAVSAGVVGAIAFFAWRTVRAEQAMRQSEARARERQDTEERLLSDIALDSAWRYLQAGNIRRARAVLKGLRPADQGRFAWRYLWGRSDVEYAVLPSPPPNGVYDLRFLPDGLTLLASGGNGVWAWDRATGKARLVRTLRNGAGPGDDGLPVALSPDGDWVLLLRDADTLLAMNRRTARIHPLLRFRRDSVPSITFSTDGRLLATADRTDGTVRVWRRGRDGWSVPAWTVLPRPRDPAGGVTSHALAFSPDGRVLAVGDRGGRVILRDTATGRPLPSAWLIGQQHGSILALAYAPDGSTVAVSSAAPDAVVRLWDTRTGSLQQTFPGGAAVTTLAFSPDGRTLATGSLNQNVRLWDARTGVPTMGLQAEGRITALAFSTDGRLLATGAHGEPARVWDVTAGGEDRVPTRLADLPRAAGFLAPGGVALVALSRDVRRIAGVSEASPTYETDDRKRLLRVWDAVTALQFTPPVPDGLRTVAAVCLSPDGRRIAVAGTAGPGGETVRVFDARTGRVVPLHPGIRGIAFSAAFSPDGRILATGHRGLVRLWGPAATGRSMDTVAITRRDAVALAFSPDGHLVAAGGADGAIDLLDAASGRPVEVLSASPRETGSTPDRIYALAFSPDGAALAAAGPGPFVRVWRRSIAGGPYRLAAEAPPAHTGPIWAVAFSPDGQTLATGGKDGTILLWDAMNGREILTLSLPAAGDGGDTIAVAGLAFTPDGRALISLNQAGELHRWTAVSATGSHTGKLRADSHRTSGSHRARGIGDTPSRIRAYSRSR